MARERVEIDPLHPPRHLLTVAEVAAYVRLSPTTVRMMVAREHLRAIRIGGELRFRWQHLQEDLDEMQANPPPPTRRRRRRSY